jgi:hypothetical protein
MAALFFSLLILLLLAMLFRLAISLPVLRELSAAVDSWADSVHGRDAGNVR